MLISCPNCKSTFAVPANAIGANGRKLKCSKCTHIWHQVPAQFDKKLNSFLETEFKESNNLPATIKPKFRPLFAASLAVLMLLVAVVQIIKSPQSMGEMVGVQNLEGLRFNNMKVTSELVDNAIDIYVSGEIINVSDKKIKIPPVKLAIYSKGGRVMANNQLLLQKKYLEPFEVFPIKPEITRVSGNARNLELSFENWAEASFR